MTAGGSAAARAAQLRAQARRGLWRRVLAWLGLSPAARRADALARRSELGGEWERRTAAMLAPLEGVGWHVLHDRALPGCKANLDHVLVSPCGTGLVVLDTKRWHAGRPTRLIGGRVHCGLEDRQEQVEKVARYAVRVAGLLGLPVESVVPMLVVHASQIVSPGFPAGRLEARAVAWRGVVHVLGPEWLVPTLVSSPDGRDPGRAAVLAGRVARVLPPYVDEA